MTSYTNYADPIMPAIEPERLVPGFLEFGQVVLLALEETLKTTRTRMPMSRGRTGRS
jgi:hypothetical protein